MYNPPAQQFKRKIGFIGILIIFYYVISPFLYLLRAIVGDYGVTAVILRTAEPVLLLTTFGACLVNQRVKWNGYSLTFTLIGLYGLLVACLQGNNPQNVLAGYARYMTGIILFIYYYTLGQQFDRDRFMRVLTYTMLSCYAMVLAFIYAMPMLLGFRIYLGLACQVLIAVFFYNYQKRRIFLALLSLVLILLSGKRGVFVALFFGLTFSVVFLILQRNIKTTLKTSFVIILASISILVVLPMTNDQLLNKYVFNDNDTMDAYSAGRWNEITSAYENFSNNFETMLIGNGFGFTYTYIHSMAKMADTEDYKNVHFSYLNPVIIFGFPMSLLYFSCLFLLFFRLARIRGVALNEIKWSSMTYLIYACFVFNLFNEPIFWMMNGFLFSYINKSKNTMMLRSQYAT